MPSERSFAWVMTVACAVIFAVLWGFHGSTYLWMLFLSGLFLVLGLFCPNLLRPLNYLWFKLGLLLHLIVSPIIMGLVFFGVVTPFSWAMRACGHRFIDKDNDRTLKSYWKPRKDCDVASRFGKQF